ncbi:XRE family transcriptional regulator [Loktanella sp. IMCC34160]|uniref:helix-turn-helix domain-containing protein n=1 Tax=Rhodobacterales TaxID=204455 RepID=UPI00101D34EA|nr:XRE family transcriptional regulator [Loktanella sp. IMCC34160]RYG91157.1 XRE family transcriptional regulator [Loktanella sp. IMCC34160]
MSEDHVTDVLSRLPGRLKEARQRQGLSLDAVAKLSGVSKSMVSQIERGESSPTVATLWNLTRALQVDFAGLLDDGAPPPGIEVVTAAQAPKIAGHGKGCRITILSAPEQVGVHEVYDLRLDAGGNLHSDPHGTGAREHLTVLEGRVTVRSGDNVQDLNSGDTARYAADVPHAIIALDGPARAFLIVETP